MFNRLGRFSRLKKRRSASEVQSLSYVVSDVGFVDDGDKMVLYNQCEKCRKIIDGMLNYLRGVKQPAKPAQPAKPI